MKFKKIKLCVILMLAIGFAELKAQEAIPASGGNALGAGGSVTYTVGQAMYTNNLASSGSEAQGIQQPFEISIVSGLEHSLEFSLKCSVYPNPANDFLILTVTGKLRSTYLASLFDFNGKMLTNTSISSAETKIDLHGLAPSAYFLKILETSQISPSKQMNNQTSVNQLMKTFKIIKN
jgi:hypothetical protein